MQLQFWSLEEFIVIISITIIITGRIHHMMWSFGGQSRFCPGPAGRPVAQWPGWPSGPVWPGWPGGPVDLVCLAGRSSIILSGRSSNSSSNNNNDNNNSSSSSTTTTTTTTRSRCHLGGIYCTKCDFGGWLLMIYLMLLRIYLCCLGSTGWSLMIYLFSPFCRNKRFGQSWGRS